MSDVKVRNRNNGNTGYVIPDTGIRRLFTPGETKVIPMDELKALQYVDGGDYLLKNYLIIEDDKILETLNMSVEPEYFYTEDEIKKLLMEGTIDQLTDCLNFAPNGVIELLKNMAVDLEVPDTRKRSLISEKTGFNIDNAINVRRIMNADSEETATEEKAPERKAEPVKRTAAPVKKTTVITK